MAVASDIFIVLLTDFECCTEKLIGGKGAKLAQLTRAGFQVPIGFCVTVNAYRRFVHHNQLVGKIKMELGRKALADFRWEELWDAALRIRSSFLSGVLPVDVSTSIKEAYERTLAGRSVVVRSSAIDEDSSVSFAGIHESIVDVFGLDRLFESICSVWASLWSDAALLYRSEMNLDPASSAMAVVVQALIPGGPSGVAFGRDPRDLSNDVAVIEAVPGPNRELVDGEVDPDRWIVKRATGELVETRRGERNSINSDAPLLREADLRLLLKTVLAVERLFGWPADVEWTGQSDRLTLLQARPITSGKSAHEDEERRWYLSLRPSHHRLRKLADRVANQLIPELKDLGDRLAGENIETMTDKEVAAAVKKRLGLVQHWRKTYYDEFIPLAHGVRQLGFFYNSVIQPADPYEFMGLLQGEEMLASKRNRLLIELAEAVRNNAEIRGTLNSRSAGSSGRANMVWEQLRSELAGTRSGREFLDKFESLLTDFTDLSFDGDRLSKHPEVYLHAILEMSQARRPEDSPDMKHDGERNLRERLEEKLLGAVGQDQRKQAQEMIELGRLSWRLRDDDNILVGRLESQLIRALQVAAERLIQRGHMTEYERLTDKASLVLADALLYSPDKPIHLEKPTDKHENMEPLSQGKPRQLVGQPAGPGYAFGSACVVNGTTDLLRIRQGQVLVCDAIQPNMTHIVPLVSGIVERRGGMLIHGAIIARELGIPCVNGVADAVNLIMNDEMLTVDGYLGIVTVGPAEFDLEAGSRGRDHT